MLFYYFYWCFQILNTLHPHLISFVPNLISIVVRLLNGEIDLRKLIKLCNRITPYVHNGHVTSTDDMMLEVSSSI